MEFRPFLRVVESDYEVDLDKTDYQLFEEYFNSINKYALKCYVKSKSSCNVKSLQSAEAFRFNGNADFKRKNFGRAMDLYNMSLACAPRNSAAFGYALANRSAVLYEVKNYKDCLLDIQNVFKSKYPTHIYYKVLMRKANCLFKLKAYGEACKEITNARSSFKTHQPQIPAVTHTLILDKILRATERIMFGSAGRVSEIVKYEDDYALPDLKDGENPKFINASSAIDIKTNGKGRHVIANCDIKKGDVLFVEKAYSFTVLKLIRRFTYCQNCMKYSVVCIPCTKCTTFFYCSDECQEASWHSNHQWTCAGTRKNLLTNEMYLALHVVFRASQNGFNSDINDETVFGDKDENYPYLNTLVTHRGEGMLLDLTTATFLVVYLLNDTNYFNWLYEQRNRPNWTRTELIVTVGSYLMKHLRHCFYNMNRICELHLCEDDRNKKHISLGLEEVALGLYVSSALLNHSCIPNTTESYEQDVKVVKATEDIQKGREVTVSYIVEHYIETDTEARQFLLKKTHKFVCTCPACLGCPRIEALEAWSCLKCSGPAVEYSDGRKAKCFTCSFKFKTKPYKKKEKEFLHHLIMYDFLNNVHSLEVMEQIMKEIYSSNHFMYLRVYSLFINFYLDNGDIKKMLRYYRLLLNTDTVLEEKAFIADWAKYIYFLSKYCKSLPDKQCKEYRDTYTEAIIAIGHIMKLMNIYTNQRCATKIYQMFNRYLDFDGPMQFAYLFGKPLFIE